MSVIEAPTTTTVEQEQVRRGAAWLDENIPGWEEKIDLTRLDLNSCENCVVGQVYGVTHDNPYRYFEIVRDFGLRERALGFHAYDERDRSGWARLTEAWRDEVTSRR